MCFSKAKIQVAGLSLRESNRTGNQVPILFNWQWNFFPSARSLGGLRSLEILLLCPEFWNFTNSDVSFVFGYQINQFLVECAIYCIYVNIQPPVYTITKSWPFNLVAVFDLIQYCHLPSWLKLC